MARNLSEPDNRTLQTALQETTTAATIRAAEGQKIFSPIAVFLDKHRNQSTGLSPHLQNALAILSDDLAAVAQRHFNAYISGITLTISPSTPSPALNPAPAPLPPSPPPSRPPSGLAQSSYATVTKPKPNPAKSLTAVHQTKSPKKKLTTDVKQTHSDHRLFVRLPDDHAAKKIDSYAIFSSLRSQLGTSSNVLKEVQTIKTGFALCPASPEALPILEAQKEVISAYFGNCQIEWSSQWISYRVTNLPKKIGQIINGQYSVIPVNPAMLSAEVAEQTGRRPVSVSETATSAADTNSLSSSWFVNFSEDTKISLPARLRLFGTVTNARFLTRKVTVIQCNRCWKWHNPRSCARPPRCRLCGSSEHAEERHTNNCSIPGPHCCPPRCFHCHGPHPADFPEFLLRPKAGITHTKAQRAEIRKTSAITLAKARTEQGCSSERPTDTQEQAMAIDIPPTQTQVVSPFRPTTPPPQEPPKEPPATASTVRFATPKPQNRFNSLLEEQL
ncbi:polymerase [Penicillium brevicompactum]|uniref:polymerase n=1 Tax=Penicillium brevicompactum TaxID=5074 RepID=UPI002540E835|nr:polymerase [Penicillium brevicompactum]KAJ5335821.1 polymerase [Penicillium brevicompactum]